jgi:putative FmdB family regulatory protein
MPIYEFTCGGCGKKVEIFRRSASSTAPFTCPACGSDELNRLVSRFAVHRSVSELASADEEQYIEGLESGDPRAMAAFARHMAAESGEPMDAEMQQMVAEMETGHMPEGMDDDLDDVGDDEF